MKSKKFYLLIITAIIIAVIIYQFFLNSAEKASGVSNTFMPSASGHVIDIDINAHEITLKLDQKYFDAFSGYQIIKLKCVPSVMDAEKISNIHIWQYIFFNYSPSQVNQNTVEGIAEIY